jgi:hypothetical protein
MVPDCGLLQLVNVTKQASDRNYQRYSSGNEKKDFVQGDA